jgi:hypothetical protein
MGPDHYFILIYDVPSRELEVHEFAEDYGAAVEAYDRLEKEHRQDRSAEVVLVGADSIETIHKTHSHYFAKHADDLFRQFLEGAAVPAGSDPRVMRMSRPRRRRGA